MGVWHTSLVDQTVAPVCVHESAEHVSNDNTSDSSVRFLESCQAPQPYRLRLVGPVLSPTSSQLQRTIPCTPDSPTTTSDALLWHLMGRSAVHELYAAFCSRPSTHCLVRLPLLPMLGERWITHLNSPAQLRGKPDWRQCLAVFCVSCNLH